PFACRFGPRGDPASASGDVPAYAIGTRRRLSGPSDSLGLGSAGMNDQAMGQSGEIARWRRHAGVALALVSFLIYAILVFLLPQVRDGGYCCEQSSFAAAVSDVVHGAPLGTMYSGVFEYFVKNSNEPLEAVLRDTSIQGDSRQPQVLGQLMPTTEDGNGIGYLVVATTAFRVFG